MARIETNEPNRLISAAVGLAIPHDKNHYGYLSEHHDFGQKEDVSGEYAEDLAARCLQQHWGFHLIQTRLGTNVSKCIRQAGRFQN